jgi:hypothetical protein
MEIALTLLAALALFVGYHAYKKYAAGRAEESKLDIDEKVLAEVWPPEPKIEEVEITTDSPTAPPSAQIYEAQEAAANKPIKKPKIKIAK